MTATAAPAAPDTHDSPAPLAVTPYQPTGPYPQVMLDLPTGTALPLSPVARGQRIVVAGTLFDGAGAPIADAMIETWQADGSGHYAHPRDPRALDADPAFWGYRRVATDQQGRFRLETVKPGRVEGSADNPNHNQAPHILMGIYGGGVLYRYVTRLYFDDEPLTAADPVLAAVPAHRRETLMAHRDEVGTYRFDIRLQGQGETVFFDL